ncbi:MAG: cupin domain-containing protein [Chloroflexi bacterium]|nr:cupin domain-containing protein [Chloroflexota bacterium]
MAIDVSPQQRLEAFYEQVKGESLRPLWLNPPNPAEPSGQVQPYLWPWQTVRASMLEACEVMPLGEEGADRRVLTMVNPTMPPHSAGPTRTLTAAVQLVKPGEEAPSHRHTMAALRFIIEGDGGYTVVDGEPLTMSPGDFLLTPSWTWHGHAHEGSANMLWLDVLDVPLVRTLDLGFYEEFAEPKQLQPASKPRDEGAHRYGAGSMLPTWQQAPSVPYSPLFSYPFSASRDALYRLTDLPPSPTEGYALTYVNPFTGGPVMPTIGASMHLLVSGQSTTLSRTTANAIFHVAQGSGHSILNGQRFDWQFGDTFCVPSWCWQEHQAAASGDAILFQASDAPALQALALLREESDAQQ